MLIPLWMMGSIGNVVALTGKVTVERAKKILPLKYGASLEVRDKIRTAKQSRVQIILTDQTIVTIGENSFYSFDAYRFNKRSDSKVHMKLRHGFFRIISGKIGKLAPERFKVEGKSATIGIRGTHFFGLVTRTDERYGCIKGRIYLVSKIARLTIDAGKMASLQRGAWKITPIDTQYIQPPHPPAPSSPESTSANGQELHNVTLSTSNPEPLPPSPGPNPKPPHPEPPYTGGSSY